MSSNSSNGTIDPGAFNGTIDPGAFASIMQGIQFLNSLGMSASQNSNMRGGNDPNLNGVSSSGATAMTHGNANTLKGTNLASNATGGTPRPSKSTTHHDSRGRSWQVQSGQCTVRSRETPRQPHTERSHPSV